MSLMNITLIFFIMILMVGFSLVLSHSVSAIVLRPLEKLLTQVRTAAATIFNSVTDMAVKLHEGSEEDEEEDEDDEDGVTNALGGETRLLEKVFQKLSALSEITMNVTGVDAATMEGLNEDDNAVINAFCNVALGSDLVESTADEGGGTEVVDYNDALRVQNGILETAGLSPDLMNSWNVNTLEFDKHRNRAAAMYCLGGHNHGIYVDPLILGQFLEAAEVGYVKAAPYHNWFHAVDVTHGVYRFFNLCSASSFLSNDERFALLVSATCHDIGHPGWNNIFLLETSHDLALRYNDRSPLENMHCAKLFEIVGVQQCNVFSSLSKKNFQEVRKVCIEAILHTDNSQHFAMIKDVSMLYEVNSELFDVTYNLFCADEEFLIKDKDSLEFFKQPAQRQLFVKLFLHFADISNCMKPYRICSIWAQKVLEEFFMQGDEEARFGIPVQALNDRSKVNRAFSQVGFIEFLVTPLVIAVVKVLPPLFPLGDQMVKNTKTWYQRWLEETKPTPGETEKKALADRIAKLEAKYQGCHR